MRPLMAAVLVFLSCSTAFCQVINAGKPVQGLEVKWISAQSAVDSAYNAGKASVPVGYTKAQIDSAGRYWLDIGLRTMPDSLVVEYWVKGVLLRKVFK